MDKEETPSKLTKSTIEIRKEQHYSGPLPPPAMLERYNQIVPGAAERILKMAESQSAHRQNLEKTVIKFDTRNSTLGVICALLIALGGLFLAFYAIRMNHVKAGVIISTIDIVGLVSTFIYGTQIRRQEREKRNKQQ
ncbi:MAG: DUF2335 domain-containing protein [Endomicrobiales bacterium]|nr:DUF2335 domain-containing protein [Endomicrobiales bacterium]